MSETEIKKKKKEMGESTKSRTVNNENAIEDQFKFPTNKCTNVRLTTTRYEYTSDIRNIVGNFATEQLVYLNKLRLSNLLCRNN